MSPLFHKTEDGTQEERAMHGRLPSLFELGPQLEEVVKSAAGQWLDGLVTTRRGRSALADGTVEQIVGQAYRG